VTTRRTTLIGIAARGFAAFLGGFLVIGAIGEARLGATDLGLWFIDLTDLPHVVRFVVFGLYGVLLVSWLGAGRPRAALRRATAITSLAAAVLAARDVLRFAAAVSTGLVRPGVPIPLSLPLAVVLAALGLWIWRDRGLDGAPAGRVRLGVLAAAGICALAFPVAQIAFFGTTDYRRPADAAVVFGARVYATGDPSPLLADRIATGVELYHQGLVPVLIMSGGDGADGFNEARVMRDRAVAAGVDPAAIEVDPSGVTTEASVGHAMTIMAGLLPSRVGPPRLVAVSQAYHLPRIQLAFSTAGIDVLTVPAVDPVPISEMPILVAREIPAFWLYYLRACLG
jgi:vancomycin permeability regulator SanA